MTWSDGVSGTTVGTVSANNSLVGSLDYSTDLSGYGGDQVGSSNYYYSSPIFILPDGNYLVVTPNWGSGKGAVTWGSEASGVTGTISAANSLVGNLDYSTDPYYGGDQVGGNLNYNIPVTILPDGNYVVVSSDWNSGKGAVTWGSETSGVTGTVSAANSLIGSLDYSTDLSGNGGDQVGNYGITVLANGNYVVGSPNWGSGKGAVTWGSEASGVTGTVSASNSLVGTTDFTDPSGDGGDQVGNYGITVLANGNYVVSSPNWGSGKGAVTWGSEASGVSGTISASNSLVGSLDYTDLSSNGGDQVGNYGIMLLSNGNYVVSSPNWNNGDGAATFASETSGIIGTISAANSILGSNSSIGLGSIVENIANGTFLVPVDGTIYVVSSSTNPNALNFSFLPSANFTVDNSYLASVLGGGTNVTLQANNDITISNDITVTGGSGSLTLDAGRSILDNANITTNGGNLTLLANEPTSAGTVNANRDAGTAVITMAGGTSISAGGGTVDIELMTGTGLTNHASGDITLNTVSGSSITAVNRNSGNMDLNGQLTASGSGNAIVVAAGGNFDNAYGSSVLNLTGSGRWVVYSTQSSADTNGASSLSPTQTIYSNSYGTLAPSSITTPTYNATQNTWVYGITGTTNVGTITITAEGQTVTYGTGPNTNAILNTTYACSGSGCSDISGLPGLSITTGMGGVTTSTSGNYNVGTWTGDIADALGTLTFNAGFTGTFNFVAGTLTVNKLGLTISGLTASKTYDGADTGGITIGGSATLNTPITNDNIGVNASGAAGTFADPNAGTGNKTVNFSGYALSGTDAGDYSLSQPSITTGTVSTRAITLAAGNQSETYGSIALGTSDFSLTSGTYASGQAATGVTLAATDINSLGTSGSGNDNVGTWKISESNATGTGGFTASNYNVTYTPGTLTITPLGLTISGLTASKTYDGADTGGITIGGSATLNTPITNDNVGVNASGASAAFADPNAGTGNKTVNFSGYALSGTDAGDYSLSQPSITNGTINTRAITLTAGNQSETYGSIALGTSDFSLTSGTYASGQAATGVTLAATDINSLGTSGSGNDNVGAWKISESNATGSGGFTGSNYNITYTPGTLTITPLGLTISGLTASKTYDGADSGGITIGGSATLNTPITNDNVGVNASGASAGFTDPNAGTGNKTVNFSGYALSGTDAGDYSLAQPNITTGTINTRPITLTAGNQSQTYGSIALGTSDFSLTGGSYASGQAATGVTLAATDINSLGTSGSNNDNVGAWKISESNATGSGGFTGSNYNITYTPGTLTITPLGLTISGLTASKTYDGADTGGITIGGSATLNTPITNDNVGVNASGASAAFTDPNAGTGNKTVNFSGYALSGTDAGDYSLSQPSITTGTVSTRAITLTAGNQSETYGSIALGTSDFSLTSGTYASGQAATGVTLAATDINSLGTSTSGNDNAGTWKISESNATGSGGFTGSNYNITYTPGTLTITPLGLTISGLTASKTYDGADTGGITIGGSATLNTPIVSDNIGINALGASAAFADPNAGTGNKTVNFSGYALSGTDAGDYSLAQPNISTGTINTRPITLTAGNQSQTYGSIALGTSDFSLTGGSYASGQAATGVTLAATDINSLGTSGSGNDNVGAWKISESNATGSGGFTGSNYNITYTPGTLTITPLGLTISGLTASKTYDGADSGGITIGGSATLNTPITNDNVGVNASGASAGFTDPNAGTGNKTVNFSGYALSGTDAGDYSLSQPSITTGTVSTRAITLTAGNQSETYGSIALGTSDFSLTSGTYASGQAATGVTLAATDINSLGTSTSGNDNAGTWKISESNATGSGGFTGSNYNITYTPGTLTITPLGLTISGLTASKTYDGADTGGITIGGRLRSTHRS